LRKMTLLAVPAAMALFASPAMGGNDNPTLKVSPKSTVRGAHVVVSGTNWGQAIAQECPDKIKLYLIKGGESTRIRSIFTNGAQETFSQSVGVPRGLAAGTYVLKAAQKCSAEDANQPTVGRAKTGLTIR
jgi:hypothetical protein